MKRSTLSTSFCVALSLSAALALLAGCPSAEPNKNANDPQTPEIEKPGGVGAKDGAKQDDPAAVEGLKAAGAALKTDSNGNVTEVTLTRGNNDDLKHLAGLPHCTILSAEVRGITGEGLAHLKGHPALKVVRLEQSDVKNPDAEHLLAIPHLDELDLRKTEFTAPAYVILAKSKTLRKIRAPQTAFDDQCLAAIGGMKQLVALELTDCKSITAAGCEPLGNLTNLEMLKLYGKNSLDDRIMEYLAKLKKLKVLTLVYASVSKDGLEKLKDHPALRELDLYGCSNINSDAMEVLGKFKSLEVLGLRETAVTNKDLKQLAGLKKLRKLDLSESNVGQSMDGVDFSAVTALQSLQDLNVWKSKVIDADLPAVGKLKDLKRLNLDNTKVTDQGLASLKELGKLEYLHLGKTNITDAGLAELHALKNLKHLIVTVVPGISDDGVAELQKAVPGLTKIER